MVNASDENAVRFFHFDREGNTIMLTDAAGQISDAYAYGPYGNILAQTGDTVQPFTFGGQYGVRQETAVTGLYHMRERFYHADTARFLTRDSQWPNILQIKELNPYQYAQLDPFFLSDPQGTGPMKSIGTLFAKDIKKLAGMMKPTGTQIVGNSYNGTPEGFLPGGNAMVNRETLPDMVGEAVVSLTIGAYLDAVGMPAQWTGDALEKFFQHLAEQQNYENLGFKQEAFVDLQARLAKMSQSEREAAIKFLKKNARVLFDLFRQWQEWQKLGPIPVGGGAFDPTRNERLDITVFSRTGAPGMIPLALYGGSREVQKVTGTIGNTAKKVVAEPLKQIYKACKGESTSANKDGGREMPLLFKELDENYR